MHGTQVSDIQSNVVVANNAITGTLYYQDRETSPLARTMGEGYFIALRYEDIDPTVTSVLVQILPTTEYEEIINLEDKHTVFIVEPNVTENFSIIQKRGTEEKTMVLDLTGLEYEQ